MKKLVNTLLISTILGSQAMATGKIDFITHPGLSSQAASGTLDPIGGAITHGSKGGIKKDSELKERENSIAEEKKAKEEAKEKEDKATVHGSKGGLQKELETFDGDQSIFKILDFLKKENKRLVKPDSDKGDNLKEESGKKKFISKADTTPEADNKKCDDKVGGFAIANLLNLKSP